MYQYNWMHGNRVPLELLSEMSELYSAHYGFWGDKGRRPGEHIRLSAETIRRNWLAHANSRVVFARAFGMLVGYAIAVQFDGGSGFVTWVTQLVVHEEHRRSDVGKTLLFTLWQFTDHIAWGLVSANPFAVRALEKATRRRCSPGMIAANSDAILRWGTEVVSYLSSDDGVKMNANEASINTRFYLDHAELPAMLRSAQEKVPWLMGNLEEGWEWLAFTFREQQQFQLADKETEQMLRASDGVTKHAFSRMAGQQPWMKSTASEVAFIIQNCSLIADQKVLDFGCGSGRHAIGLAKSGIASVGVDYVQNLIATARARARQEGVSNAAFMVGDCRDIELGDSFDAAICIYDVIGTYAEDADNLAILRNLARYVKPGGHVLLSVMNMELTLR